MEAPPRDTFEHAIETVRAANAGGLPLKLIGGQAVRVLCPRFPHRAREDQDMDFACVSTRKRDLIDFFAERGFLGDRKFNTLHGDRQMYFTTPDGATSVDVVMDRLNMCHVLDFQERIDRLPDTLDVSDLLLSKLQVIELNRKDVHDLLHLLSGFPVADGDEPGTIGRDRIGRVVAEDWGWWRTVTMNLEKVAHFAEEEAGDLVPEARTHEPGAQARALRACCDDVPKSLRWKLRSRVGDRVQWYQLPEEVGH
ncbi:MAG TPA: hypothetical protein VFQ40_05565 [Actinomycetota bacterium]|nr:hypothetical protein [Actinomycetota bacterium]